MELGSKVQSKENIFKEKEDRWIHSGREKLIKVGSEYIWLWIIIEPECREILELFLDKWSQRKETCLLPDGFCQVLSESVELILYQQTVELGTQWLAGSWTWNTIYFLFFDKVKKSVIERAMQYIKDRTECFDDYFSCKKKNSKLRHVRKWLNLFVDNHNSKLNVLKWREPNCDIFLFLSD